MNLPGRFFLAILVGWITNIILLILIIILLFVGIGLYSQYQGFSKELLTQRFIQNPWEAMRVGIIVLVATIGSASLSSGLAGWIAQKKGWICGIIVSPLLPILGFFGSILQGRPITLNMNGLVTISLILAIGAFFGFLGEKLYKRK